MSRIPGIVRISGALARDAQDAKRQQFEGGQEMLAGCALGRAAKIPLEVEERIRVLRRHVGGKRLRFHVQFSGQPHQQGLCPLLEAHRALFRQKPVHLHRFDPSDMQSKRKPPIRPEGFAHAPRGGPV